MVVCDDVRDSLTIATSRIRAEYLEMPGLSLTETQAARLLGLDRRATVEALGSLERDGFLQRTSSAQFVRGDTILRRRDVSVMRRLSEVA